MAVESLSSGCYIHFSNSASRIYPEYTESPEMVMELINKAIEARRQALDFYGACTLEYWRLDGSGGGHTKAKP